MPNESAKIILKATHGKLSKIKDFLAIEGTINALKVNFQFATSDWNDTTKTVVFVRGRATPSATNVTPVCVILDENSECDVPAEILAKEGVFSVGVFGTRDDYRIVSNWMCYKIDNGCYTDGSEPIDPSSTIYEQILKMLENKSNTDHIHDDRYYTKEEVEDRFISEEELVQPDWSQNDENNSSYVQNRTHYIIPRTLITSFEMQFNLPHYSVDNINASNLIRRFIDDGNDTVDMFIDGILYKCKAQFAGGNYIINLDGSTNTGQGMYIYVWGTKANIITLVPETFGLDTSVISRTIEIYTPEIIYQLDEKYIPDSIARISDIPEGSLRVTFSVIGENNYIADTTYDEITAAIDNGRFVYGYIGGMIIPYLYNGVVGDVLLHQFVFDYTKEGVLIGLFVNPDNTITFGIETIVAPNPNSLTFTGAISAIYDGSRAVTVNIPRGITSEEVDSKIASLVNSYGIPIFDDLDELKATDVLADHIGKLVIIKAATSATKLTSSNFPMFCFIGTTLIDASYSLTAWDTNGRTYGGWISSSLNKLSLSLVGNVYLKPNWNQTDDSAIDYIANKPTIPTKTSDLINDSRFITEEYIDNILDETELNTMLEEVLV